MTTVASRPRPKVLLAAIALFAAGAVVGYAGYRMAIWVEVDLTPLANYAKTENYEALYKRIQERDPAPDGFSFIALGDTRTFYQRAHNILARAAEEAPAFILSNGDIVRHGTVEEYIGHHLRLVKTIAPIPFIPAPGNHEEGPNRDFAAFEALYGGLRFSFDYGDCRFVGVNNGDLNKMGGNDLRFLEQELKKPGAQHKFVVCHVPPAFLEEAVQSESSRGFSWNANAFHTLMKEQKVDHVFLGHVHGFATTVIDGVRYTITGGGGANLTDKLGEAGKVHHFIVVHVTPDGLQNEIVKLVDDQWVREPI